MFYGLRVSILRRAAWVNSLSAIGLGLRILRVYLIRESPSTPLIGADSRFKWNHFTSDSA